jgi:hypothetical protein
LATEPSIRDGTPKPDAFYYWIDYSVEVEFKNGFMDYILCIKGIEEFAQRGKVNLASSIEVCASGTN